jgi:hypothetical protein
MIEVDLPVETYADAIGVTPDQPAEVRTSCGISLPSGEVAVLQSIGLKDRRSAGNVLLAIQPDGSVTATHLYDHIAPIMGTIVSMAAMADGVVLHVLPLHRAEARATVVFVPWRGAAWGAPEMWTLTRALP